MYVHKIDEMECLFCCNCCIITTSGFVNIINGNIFHCERGKVAIFLNILYFQEVFSEKSELSTEPDFQGLSSLRIYLKRGNAMSRFVSVHRRLTLWTTDVMVIKVQRLSLIHI